MQNEQLAYVAVTPYSMRKSRTGGIVGRLISRTGLDLVGGRMFAPSRELAKRYAGTIHGFFSLGAVLDQGKQAMADAAAGLRAIFAS